MKTLDLLSGLCRPIGVFSIGLIVLAHNSTHPIGWAALVGAVVALGYWGRE